LAGLKLDITSPSPVAATFLPNIDVLPGFASTLTLFVMLAYSVVTVELVFTAARETSTFTCKETCIRLIKESNFPCHNEELHNLYSSPSIIRIIKSRRMRWVGHVAQMGQKRNVYRLLVGKPERDD
jgi:hypothetical protein